MGGVLKGLNMQGDYSPVAMFIAADIVVKSVMAGLAAASVIVWAIWASKVVQHLLLRRRLRAGIAVLDRHGRMTGAKVTGPVAELLGDAATELAASAMLPAAGIKERAASALSQREATMIRQAQSGVAVIGSVGAIAPFVGLFGTVWGIMNSFTGIAASGNTNLAAVAPGIAEALLATAIGLIAAIPAVLLYNHLARSAASLRALLADAVALVERTLSRELDRAALSESPPSSFPATMHHLHVAE
mgnify:CR=1 FL=1